MNLLKTCLAVYLAALLFSCAGLTLSQDLPIAFRAKRLYTGVGEPIENGVLLVRNGIITAVGPADLIPIPAGTSVREAEVITPGFIDPHSHIGLFRYLLSGYGEMAGENNGPMAPEFRVAEVFDETDPEIAEAVKGGVTAVAIRPGSAKVIAGQSALLKLRPGRPASELVARSPLDLKMALEWNPLLVYGGRRVSPRTRMKMYSMVREKLREAQDYRWKRQLRRLAGPASEGDEEVLFDPGLSVLERLLSGDIPAHVHTSRADEIIEAMRLADEFGFRIVLAHAEWGFLVAEEIAKRDVICVVGPRLFRPDPRTGELVNIADALTRAGVRVAFQTDHPVCKQQHLRYNAALAVRYGMDPELALAGITRVAAESIDSLDRIGTLEIGKDADLVLMDGPPLEMTSRVLATVVEGTLVYDGEQETR